MATTHWRLPFSKKRFESLRDFLDHILHPSVLWFPLAIFIAISSFILGLSFKTPDDGTRWDKNFYSLMSQVCLTIPACYYTLVPILHAHLNSRVGIQVNVFLFYFFLTAALATALAAPIIYVVHGKNYENISNLLNFTSSACSIIIACQLGAGVLKLGK